jgi:DNA polymerase-3 subunit beta
MKAVCLVKPLAMAAAAASRVCNGHSTVPILAHLLLRVENGTIEVVATDLQTTLAQRLATEQSEAGAVTLPAKLFSDYLAALPADSKISLDGTLTRVTARVERGAYEFSALPADDYPPLPRPVQEAPLGELPGSVLQAVVSATAFCASTDDHRGAITGVSLRTFADGTAAVACTDGFRLAEARLRDIGCDAVGWFIVPTAALIAAARTIGKAEQVSLRLLGDAHNQLAVECEDATLTVRLADGQYPNYEQIIPKESKRRVRVNVPSLISALRRAVTVVGDRANLVRLAFGPDSVALTASSDELGNAHEELALTSSTGSSDDLMIALNARYLIEILAHAECEEVEFGLTEALAPVRLEPVDPPEGAAYTLRYVLMPLRP